MHVLITGASGYLGSVLLECLGASPLVSRVSVLSRQDTGSRIAQSPDVGLIGCAEIDAAAFREKRFDAIFHLAAGRSSSEPEQLAGSLALTGRLLRAASGAGVARIFLASSQAIYGTQRGPWSENMAPAPVTHYGMAKYASELMASLAGVQTVSLRFAKLVGPSPKFRTSPSEIPHVLCRHALEGKPVVLKNPEQKFDLLDVRDAARACEKLLGMETTAFSGVLNVGSGRQTSLRECAERVDAVGKRQIAQPLRYQIDTSKTGSGFRDFGMSIDRIQRLCGWEPTRPLEATVADIFRHMQEHKGLHIA